MELDGYYIGLITKEVDGYDFNEQCDCIRTYATGFLFEDKGVKVSGKIDAYIGLDHINTYGERIPDRDAFDNAEAAIRKVWPGMDMARA